VVDKIDSPDSGLCAFAAFLVGSNIATQVFTNLRAKCKVLSLDDVPGKIGGAVRFSNTTIGIILKIALYVFSAGILFFVYLCAINSDAFKVTVASCCKVVSHGLPMEAGAPEDSEVSLHQAPPAQSPGPSVLPPPPTKPQNISDEQHEFLLGASAVVISSLDSDLIGIDRTDGVRETISITYDDLNKFYPNISKVVFSGSGHTSGVDLSRLTAVEAVEVDEVRIEKSLILGPGVKLLTVKNSTIGEINLLNCGNLTDVTFYCCVEKPPTSVGKLIFPLYSMAKVCMDGVWCEDNDCIDAIASQCPYGAVTNRAVALSEASHMALCSAASVEIIPSCDCKMHVRVPSIAGGETIEVVISENDFNRYANIEEITISADLHCRTDFSRLEHIKKVACIGARVAGVLVLGGNVETFIAENSHLEHGFDFSRCSKLSEVRFVSCKDSCLGDCDIVKSMLPPDCNVQVYLVGEWTHMKDLESVRKYFADIQGVTLTCDELAMDDGRLYRDKLGRVSRVKICEFNPSSGVVKMHLGNGDLNEYGSEVVSVSIAAMNSYANIEAIVLENAIITASVDLSSLRHIREVASINTHVCGDIIFGESVEVVRMERPCIKGAIDFSKCTALRSVVFDASFKDRGAASGMVIFGEVKFHQDSNAKVLLTGVWESHRKIDDMRKQLAKFASLEVRCDVTETLDEGFPGYHELLGRSSSVEVCGRSTAYAFYMTMKCLDANGVAIGTAHAKIRTLGRYRNIGKITFTGGVRYSFNADDLISAKEIVFDDGCIYGEIAFSEHASAVVMRGCEIGAALDFSKCSSLRCLTFDNCYLHDSDNDSMYERNAEVKFPNCSDLQVMIVGGWQYGDSLSAVRKLCANAGIAVAKDSATIVTK
jgi:hypothetical protein